MTEDPLTHSVIVLLQKLSAEQFVSRQQILRLKQTNQIRQP